MQEKEAFCENPNETRSVAQKHSQPSGFNRSFVATTPCLPASPFLTLPQLEKESEDLVFTFCPVSSSLTSKQPFICHFHPHLRAPHGNVRPQNSLLRVASPHQTAKTSGANSVQPVLTGSQLHRIAPHLTTHHN
ncbi:claudin-20 isoform X2 [Mesocricetus auratus]|uniref:Claudin-20 isoform X2 n=1 Tax=Mesocricetus auratus TaxID=10036 RepID=A0ABM2W863_MESAU|nr:claudin-20 isoform X2 [Mesocricetus auratus]